MHKQVIKALESKVEDLHTEGTIYCDHGETEAVAGALVDAIRGTTLEDEIRDELRTAMRKLRRQGWVHGGAQAHKEIADAVISAMSTPDFEFGVHYPQPSFRICPQSLDAAKHTKELWDARRDEGDPEGVIVVHLVGDRDWFRLDNGAPIEVCVLVED